MSIILLTAEPVPEDAAQGGSETISTEAVQEEVGGKRNVEEEVTDSLRHLCAQSQCIRHTHRCNSQFTAARLPLLFSLLSFLS